MNRMRSLVALFALCVPAVGCQVYDFSPVTPAAVSQLTERRVVAVAPLPSNIMLVVDRSGSMNVPMDPSHPGCPANCGFQTGSCGPDCPTRLGDLQTALDAFIDQTGGEARLGLTLFPPPPQVCAPGKVEVDLPASDDAADLVAHAEVIRQRVHQIDAFGGTPTTQTLMALADHPSLAPDPDRSTVVILLTDGLPNCNPGLDSATCTCSLTQNGQPLSPCPADPLHCLDDDGAVAALQQLQAAGIQTAIVAFGMDGSDTSRTTLGAMAAAGGFRRSCVGHWGCEGAGLCREGMCTEQFYRAGQADELAVALTSIHLLLIDRCAFGLDARPESESFVAVYVDGQKIAPGTDTWRLEVGGQRSTVHLTGTLCERVYASTVLNPVELEFRVIERL